MQKWPSMIPHDLRNYLLDLERMRCPTTPQDQWGAIKEWLEKHGVEPPDHMLPVSPNPEGKMGH